MKKVTEIVAELARPVVEEHGCTLWDVEYVREAGQWYLRLLIDKQGGVDPAYGYTLLYSDDKQLTAPVHHYMHQNLQLTGGRVGQIGPTIGTHIGPGAVGVAFVTPAQ